MTTLRKYLPWLQFAMAALFSVSAILDVYTGKSFIPPLILAVFFALWVFFLSC